jgi:hypothetical protein
VAAARREVRNLFRSVAGSADLECCEKRQSDRDSVLSESTKKVHPCGEASLRRPARRGACEEHVG